MNKPLRIGLLAGESSGDILGAGLMDELLKRHSDIVFEGIGGPLMIERGLKSQAVMERLSVMGYVEPLKRLPELLSIRKKIITGFIKNPPDVFIGIDSPDFNLTIEHKLKNAGITTVHYVSPSVWAWKKKRIKKIAKAVDLVLCIFPFELDSYKQHHIPASFIGHPLADDIPLNGNDEAAKNYFNLPAKNKVLALLPGSRESEVSRLAPVFLKTAKMCYQKWPDMSVLLPCANSSLRQQIETLLAKDFKDLKITLIDGQSREVMAAADCILIASGTATLEAMLLRKPMLVCYKMAALSYAIISRLLKVPFFSLPNLLANRKVVDELVQDDVNADVLFGKIVKLIEDSKNHSEIKKDYERIHHQLRKQASKEAADQVLGLINSPSR